jgi:spore germination protein GerM
VTSSTPPGTNPPTPPSGTPPPGATRVLISRRGLIIGVASGLAALLLGVWLVVARLPAFLRTPPGAAPAATGAASSSTGPTADTRKIHASLFFVAASGTELVPVSQEVPYGGTPAEQARRIVEAQLQPPPQGYYSAIPVGTPLHTVYLTQNGDAYVDLGHEMVTNHTGGSLDEILSVYAIVDAITVNMPDVTGVQILIDGKDVDTLVGHLDLRSPLPRSLKWVRKGQ